MSELQELVDLIVHGHSDGVVGPTVQRSHRFDSMDLAVMEHVARGCGRSVSAVINLVISVGIEQVMDRLPSDRREEFRRVASRLTV